MKLIGLLLVLSVIFLVGCAPRSLVAGAEQVFVTTQPAPADCVFLGLVEGSQGNWLTADVTSDKNMMVGARNELRNKAYALGANYVVIESQSQASRLEGGAYSSVVIGNAYKCPRK